MAKGGGGAGFPYSGPSSEPLYKLFPRSGFPLHLDLSMFSCTLALSSGSSSLKPPSSGPAEKFHLLSSQST